MGPGTRWRETRVMMGKEATEAMEITAFDPPHGYTAEAESCGSHYWTRFSFAPDGAGTRVEMTFEGKPLTWSARIMNVLMGWLVTPMVRKCLTQDLADVKAFIERGPEGAAARPEG